MQPPYASSRHPSHPLVGFRPAAGAARGGWADFARPMATAAPLRARRLAAALVAALLVHACGAQGAWAGGGRRGRRASDRPEAVANVSARAPLHPPLAGGPQPFDCTAGCDLAGAALVCGADGLTYAAECLAACQGVAVAAPGACSGGDEGQLAGGAAGPSPASTGPLLVGQETILRRARARGPGGTAAARRRRRRAEGPRRSGGGGGAPAGRRPTNKPSRAAAPGARAALTPPSRPPKRFKEEGFYYVGKGKADPGFTPQAAPTSAG
jgi:hypothetical protein